MADHHYVPKFYLKGFIDKEDGIIWAYEKGTRKRFPVTLNNIGHQVDFYNPQVEKFLANKIEDPANTVIRKIRNREPLTDNDKITLTKYIVVFMQRVPESLKRFNKKAPAISEKMKSETDQDIKALKERHPQDSHFYDNLNQKIHDILEDFSNNPPKESWLQYIKPQALPKVAFTIYLKRWRFFTSDSEFLTCDNPVSFFRGRGLKDKESELIFPISNDIVLWATWKKNFENVYIPAEKTIVTEFNNRIASNATKHVFFNSSEDWVQKLTKREKYRVNRIR